MQEKLLHTIWQFSLYQPQNLKTTAGESVTVIHPGQYNSNAGPDFLEAKVKVGDTTLAGHVEMHVNSSDWHKHGHSNDDAYKNVILHVVYEDDLSGTLEHIPTVCLKSAIDNSVLTEYQYLMYQDKKIPCAGKISEVRDITKYSWYTRMLAERWEQKLFDWKNDLLESKGDWSNLLYIRLAANFGFKVNTEAFMMLANSLPLKVLAKHKTNLLQIEALLFGQAGMLEEEFKDVYPNALKTEYYFLKKKYNLHSIPLHLWKFMRMRPANFPTIRIAQFAALIHQSIHLFSVIIDKSSVKEITQLFKVKASDYWDTHYGFDELSEKEQKKKLGKSSVHNLIINTVAPVKFLYASQQGTEKQKEDALKLLDELPAEQNNIISQWQIINEAPENASQSQAQIQLYNNYCKHKKCLECAIGVSILKS